MENAMRSFCGSCHWIRRPELSEFPKRRKNDESFHHGHTFCDLLCTFSILRQTVLHAQCMAFWVRFRFHRFPKSSVQDLMTMCRSVCRPNGHLWVGRCEFLVRSLQARIKSGDGKKGKTTRLKNEQSSFAVWHSFQVLCVPV